MAPLSAITPDAAACLVLAAPALAGAWLALKGFAVGTPRAGTAVQAALLLRGIGERRALDLRIRRKVRAMHPEMREEDLRHPVTARTEAGEPDPSGLVQVGRLLGLALIHPEAPHPAFVAELEGMRRGRPGLGYRPGYLPDATEEAFERHAWLETAVLDLYRRCREAGSWIAPAHLDPFLADHPALASALRASHGGTASPSGAALVAHHKAEAAARRPLRVPHVGAAPAEDGEE